MTKKEIIDIVYFSISSFINIVLSFFITTLFGISNTILLKSCSAIYGDITWEVIIFFTFSIIGASIYENYMKKHYKYQNN